MAPCETCSFYGLRTKTCDYLLFTKRSRGCPAGEGCDKYEERDGVRRPDLRFPGVASYHLYYELGSTADIVKKITKGKEWP